jgi:histidinol-phosphate aminotransferase
MTTRILRVLPPYNVNAAAAVALIAALEDREHYEWYLDQVRESKTILYAAFDRLGIGFLPSEANFVLARFGERVGRVCAELAERGIHVRDRSTQPLCEGCARITAGVVAHTVRFIAALEEVLCDAR